MAIKRQELGSEQFDLFRKQVISDPQPDWLGSSQESSSHTDDIPVSLADRIMGAIKDFVNAPDWEETRRVVEMQQGLLFRPEVETLFERNITHARIIGEELMVRTLEVLLDLLRECKTIGIEEAFTRLTTPE